MLKRVITSVVALAVLAAVLIAPPIVFTIALAAVTLFMLYEVYKATNADLAMKIVGFVSAALMIASMYTIQNPENGYFVIVYVSAAIIFLAHMVLAVFRHGKRNYKDILSNGFLTLYIVCSMWCLQFTRTFFGMRFMLLTFIAAWSCDTFAYFSGRLFGRHKLIPNVSPNKTVEGAIGGVIGSIVCCFVYLCAAEAFYGADIIGWAPLFLAIGAAYGCVGGVCSQLGDLAASAIKRDTGIKDFGWIFPGHGGFMDRFDSVMFIAPIMLILTIILHG